MENLAQAFTESKDDEACIALMLKLHCIFGDLRRLLGCAKIDRYRFEYPVRGHRVDLVLFHANDGISLIEIKGQNAVREVVAGIGQLFLYESLFRESFPRAPTYIDKYLISPVQGLESEKVDKACVAAGVNFFQYAPMNLIREHRESCKEKWLAHGTEIITDA